MTKMHADERDIPVALVRSLTDTQFPQWRELALPAMELWQQATHTPAWSAAGVWVHGDLTATNPVMVAAAKGTIAHVLA